MVSLPFFASNGAIIQQWLGKDRLEVLTDHTRVITEWHWRDGWMAEVPPHWLHTDEEGQAAKTQALEAIQEFNRKRREEK